MQVVSLQHKRTERIMYVAISIPANADAKERIAIAKQNMVAIIECDRRAKEIGSLVGRVFCQPVDGGNAYYQVVSEEGEKYLTVTICSGLGVDLVMPNWGWRAKVKKEYVIFRLKQINAKFIVSHKVQAL